MGFRPSVYDCVVATPTYSNFAFKGSYKVYLKIYKSVTSGGPGMLHPGAGWGSADLIGVVVSASRASFQGAKIERGTHSTPLLK